MADRGPLLKWSPDTWKRWGSTPRMSLTAIPRTKFLLLKAPVSTAYEEKYGDRNVFTVSMYVQRLIAKGVAVGLVIDCTALDLVMFDKNTNTNSATGSIFYFHNSLEWEDFGIDYYRLCQDVKSGEDERNSDSTPIIAPATIQEFISVCGQHWKDNPTLHIAIYDSRGGQGAASFVSAYWLCSKVKAPVHIALSILEKASPISNWEQKGLMDVEMIKQLQDTFDGKKEIVVDHSKFPSWWFAEGDSSSKIVTIPSMNGKRLYGEQSGSQNSNKKPRAEDQESLHHSLPLQRLSSDSQRYSRAMTVLKQLTNDESVPSKILIQIESNLAEQNLQQLQVATYKVTWGSVGRRGLLLVLSDGTFFLENDEDNVKVSILTCPLYIPNPQKPSTCQHRTLLDVTLVMDRENGLLVPRFLVSDMLVHMGYVLTNKPFSLRLKYVKDGVILARKKSVKIWNYSKERIRIRAKEFFGLKEIDFVCNQVIKAQFHSTDGLRFVPKEGNCKQSSEDVLVHTSGDKGMMEKVLEHIAAL